MAKFKLITAGLALGAIFALPFQASAQDNVRSISLEEVFQLVQSQNPSVQAGVEGVEISRQSARQARSALLPQLSAQAQQGRSRTMADQGASDLVPEYGNSYSTSLVLSMSIIDATNIANYKAARLEESATRYQHESDVQDTLTDAARLYFLYIRNQSALKVIESSIALDEVLLNIAEERRKAEVATELDLTRARATLAKDRQNHLAQRTVLEETRLALLRTLGLDPNLDIRPLPVEAQAPRLSGLPDWMSVLESRPEYKAANELLERNRVAEKAADWQRFPSIGVSGQYGYASRMPGDHDGGEAWSVGLTMNMPLWEGGRIGSEKLQARAYIRQQEQKIREISDMVRSSYILAQRAVEQRWEEIPLAEEAVKLGELELKYARERFEANVTDNSDVVSAQLSLADAQDKLVDAIYRYQLARIDLARVLGSVESQLSE
ncbi:MAG: TolC family protein [Opitutales bacterium]|nr:TolC family protein [Opitutales bacterium]